MILKNNYSLITAKLVNRVPYTYLAMQTGNIHETTKFLFMEHKDF